MTATASVRLDRVKAGRDNGKWGDGSHDPDAACATAGRRKQKEEEAMNTVSLEEAQARCRS